MVNEIGSLTPAVLAAPASAQSAAPQRIDPPVAAARAVQPHGAGVAVAVSGFARAVSERVWEAEGLAALALTIRQDEALMREADALLAQIQDNLTRIVKQFPPFGLDSAERKHLLDTVTGLRKQLEALALPPEPRPDAHWMPGLALIGALPGLDPQPASDAALGTALDRVQQARAGLADARHALWRAVAERLGEVDEARAGQLLGAVQRDLQGAAGHALAAALRRGAADAW